MGTGRGGCWRGAGAAGRLWAGRPPGGLQGGPGARFQRLPKWLPMPAAQDPSAAESEGQGLGKDSFLFPSAEVTGSGKSSLAWGWFDRDSCHFLGPSGNSLYCLKPHFFKRNCSSCSEGHTHCLKG